MKEGEKKKAKCPVLAALPLLLRPRLLLLFPRICRGECLKVR